MEAIPVKDFVRSRRTDALLHAHDVLITFGGRSGTLLTKDNAEVVKYAEEVGTPGQNWLSALFYANDRARRIVRHALTIDLPELLDDSNGPKGVNGPRLERSVQARLDWSKK